MTMLPGVIGYADRLSVAPGERVTFRVSVLGGGSRYRAGLVRLRCGERGIAGQRSLHQPRQLGIAEQQPPSSDNRIRCAHITASAHKASARVC